MSNAPPSPNGRSPSVARHLVDGRERARSSSSSVRSGPTSSDMVGLQALRSSSAVLGASFGRGAAIRSMASRAASRPDRDGLRAPWRAPRRCGRPARPNTSASVMALPDSRLAPLAPPTASPATSRPGSSVCHPHVGRDAAHVIVRDRRHLDRHLGEVDAVRREPVDHRAERLAQLRLRQCWKLRYAPPCGEPRPASTSLRIA